MPKIRRNDEDSVKFHYFCPKWSQDLRVETAKIAKGAKIERVEIPYYAANE